MAGGALADGALVAVPRGATRELPPGFEPALGRAVEGRVGRMEAELEATAEADGVVVGPTAATTGGGTSDGIAPEIEVSP